MMVLMLLLTVPFQSVFAAMIGTETVIDMTRGQEARARLNQILTREDVKAVFITQGIDPLEAKARIASLSDAEVVRLYDQIEQLPAGGSDLGLAIAVVGIIFIILLITDILGYTDVFTIDRPQQ
ncbi:MAG: hypothetical protein BBJ57_12090 [Desulfobacterales bacterium PC51MH44]|nr:MAG: hypothetical protein BBJ57_12090 [Desulfobacterales bacterium PC51MH44]